MDQPVNWYLIRSATRQEERADTALRAKGFTVYYPSYRRFERIGRTKVWEPRRRPLFPGYMFVTVGCGQFADAESADGVSGFVRYTMPGGDRCPRKVPHSVIADLLLLVQSGEHDEADPNAPKSWELSEPVRVIAGPYAGYNGRISRLSSNKRVKVLLNAVTRGSWQWDVEVDTRALEKMA